MDEHETGARVGAELAEKYHQPSFLGDGHEGPHVAFVPEGLQVVDLKPYQDARLTRPERRKGTARLTTLASFIDHANRFRDDDSAIFANDAMPAPSLVAVLDYHARNDEDGEHGAPRFGEHRAIYAFPLSDEWTFWTQLMARQGWMSQADLAQVLEDHVVDVVEVSELFESTRALVEQLRISVVGSAELIRVARQLSIRVDAKVASAVNLSTGEGEISYEETHTDGKTGGKVTVPTGFVIGIPVARAGSRYPMICRLRYRVTGGVVTWKVLGHDVDRVFRDAFNGAVAEAGEATKLPVFYGSPES